jgi:hypothetical protein
MSRKLVLTKNKKARIILVEIIFVQNISGLNWIK